MSAAVWNLKKRATARKPFSPGKGRRCLRFAQAASAQLQCARNVNNPPIAILPLRSCHRVLRRLYPRVTNIVCPFTAKPTTPRRAMHQQTRQLVVLVVVFLAPAASAQEPGRWPANKANDWYKKQPWLVGCNFIPSTA